MSPPSTDDDRTVITSGVPSGSPAPTVPTEGAPPNQAQHGSQDLPLGTRLGEFELIEKIGEGGFSIVYLALDHSLDRKVALKEYMPSAIASRAGGTRVNLRSERHRETFDAGMRSFINEAKLLAQFDHHSLVKVYRFWEAHGTAYMVMPFYKGLTLRDTVRALPLPPDEAWLRALLNPLTEALMVIHAEHCYHRDIAPDNVILLTGSGAPLLLDFGAARRVIGDMTHALTVILKPGYAPAEQYAEIPGMQQGAWTDVYALAAVVYWIITGNTPPASAGRLLQDSYVPLAACAAGRYGMPFLEAIDRALVVMPTQRTRSIEVLRLELGLGKHADETEGTTARCVDDDATVVRMSVFGSGAAQQAHRRPSATAVPEYSVLARQPRRKRVILVGAAVCAFAIAAGSWWVFHRLAVPRTAPTVAVPQNVAPAPNAPTPPPAPSPAQTHPTGSLPRTAAPAPERKPTPEPSPSPPPPQAIQPTTAPSDQPNAAASLPKVRPTPLHATPGDSVAPPAPVRRDHTVVRTPKTDVPKAAEHRVETNPDAAECARIMQRLSLGESTSALLDRVKTLNCR